MPFLKFKIKFFFSFLFLAQLIFLDGLLLSNTAKADPIFLKNKSIGLKTLEKGKAWVSTRFVKNSSAAITEFRAWLPYQCEVAWPVFVDQNSLHRIHKEFLDSYSISKADFDLVVEKNIKDLKTFYQVTQKRKQSFQKVFKADQIWQDHAIQVFDLPWPVKNRWTLLSIQADPTKAPQSFRYSYESKAGSMKKLIGFWELVQREDPKNPCEFRGQYLSDAGISAPHFLARSSFRSALRRNVKEKINEISRQKSK